MLSRSWGGIFRGKASGFDPPLRTPSAPPCPAPPTTLTHIHNPLLGLLSCLRHSLLGLLHSTHNTFFGNGEAFLEDVHGGCKDGTWLLQAKDQRVLPQPLSLLPLPLIGADEILMLWLLAGAQPARGRVGAGRAGWREGMPHGDTREQGRASTGSVLPC